MMEKNHPAEDSHQHTNLSDFMHELSKDDYHNHDVHHGWITIGDLQYQKLILESYSDSDKRRILEETIDAPRNISEIFDICNKPQTTVYRKTMSLIKCGLLMPDDTTFKHGKKSTRYKSIFEKIRIDIIKNKISIKVKPATR